MVCILICYVIIIIVMYVLGAGIGVWVGWYTEEVFGGSCANVVA